MNDFANSQITSTVTNASSAIGNVLTALGNLIKNFDFSIKAVPYWEGFEKKEAEILGQKIPVIAPKFHVDISGSGKGLENLSTAITSAGNYFTRQGSQIADKMRSGKSYGSGKTGTTSPTKPTDTPKTPTSKTPSSGSKGSKGGSGSGSKDKYTADIDKYKELSDAVENVKDKIDELNDAYDATDNIDEQISLKNVLIGLYKDEQDALEKLNKARDKEISDNVAKLRKKALRLIMMHRLILWLLKIENISISCHKELLRTLNLLLRLPKTLMKKIKKVFLLGRN